MEKKILVAYFSASGVTRKAAEEIAAAVGGELFEIKPAVPYSEADLDWKLPDSRSSVEMNDPACRPAVEGRVEHMEEYGTVFVGFPVWWYVAPRIVDTFIEAYDFAGKRVIPFATSGGSGISGAEKRLKALCPAAEFVPGQLVNAGAAAFARRALNA